MAQIPADTKDMPAAHALSVCLPRPFTDKLEAFKKNINFLYTGCTRAKDELTIILSAPKGESIYMDLLRQSMQEVSNR
jgi:hypothetical protein